VRPLPAPYDAIAAGRPAAIACRGADLLGDLLLTKDLAFRPEERAAFGLDGLLPEGILTIDQQVALEIEKIRRKGDPLEQYIGLAALQDRNSTLFYRLLAMHLEEFLPIVYTPTVGRACQEYSHIIRRTRGLWIGPDDRDRIPELLRAGPSPDVRLIVVTDGERILGLGDLGAGGMPIPVGKLALYTAAAGIHPIVTLPVCLDVGTDNQALISDPLYLGRRTARLRGAAYDDLIEAFVAGVSEVWPGCLIQWEDFKHHNALRILDRFRDRVPCFNDDVQGTAAVVLGGVLAGLRGLRADLAAQRIVIAGAGAAGTGIASLLGRALGDAGLDAGAIRRAIVLVDSRGLVHAGRSDLDPAKRALALPVELARELGLASDQPAALVAVVRAIQPTILVGTTGAPGTFTEAVIAALDPGQRPIVLPLSNPTSSCEASPDDVMRWSGGRAIVATGSPFPPVHRAGVPGPVSQANNVYVFPGLGLGAMVAEARGVSDSMILAAARTLGELVEAGDLAAGLLYPPIGELRRVARAVAIAVAREAVAAGLAGVASNVDLEAAVDAAAWWPDYVPYSPASAGR
jgi:malic enzyme